MTPTEKAIAQIEAHDCHNQRLGRVCQGQNPHADGKKWKFCLAFQKTKIQPAQQKPGLDDFNEAPAWAVTIIPSIPIRIFLIQIFLSIIRFIEPPISTRQEDIAT